MTSLEDLTLVVWSPPHAVQPIVECWRSVLAYDRLRQVLDEESPEWAIVAYPTVRLCPVDERVHEAADRLLHDADQRPALPSRDTSPSPF